MGTILVRECLRQASDVLTDLNPQFRRWSQAFMVLALNSGCKAVAKYLPLSSARVDVVKLKPGSRQSIDSIASADVIPGEGGAAWTMQSFGLQRLIRNMGDDGVTPGRPIPVVGREALDALDPDWMTREIDGEDGIFEYTFDPQDPTTFMINPGVPSGEAWWVELSHLRAPKPILAPGGGVDYGHAGSNATALPVADEYFDDVLHYLLACCYTKDAEFPGSAALAAHFTNLFLAAINAKATVMTGVNPNLKLLPFNPALPATAS